IDGVSASGFYLQQRIDTGTFALVTTATDTQALAIFAGAPTPPGAGLWYHVAGVYDGASLILYVNGVFQASVAHSGAWAAGGTTAIGRGKYNGGITDFFPGLIDDVRLYSRALTGAEIARLAIP